MARKLIAFVFIFLVFLTGASSASPSATPARIVIGLVSNAASALFKWLWSLKSAPKTTGVTGRSMVKFESGYTVETLLDGSKLGIEPYAVEASPTGEIIILDSQHSNLYKVSSPLSRYSRPKLVTGSPEGYSGHVDGKLKEARMYSPRGMAIDDSGNIYIADTMNMAIRKITNSGVTTIAGGKWGRGGHRVESLSEDIKLSDDFDLVYVGSSCSLLVIDRGNQAIREIQLHYDDCASSSGSSSSTSSSPENQILDSLDGGNINLGVAILVAAAFSGYMLALLLQKIRALFSPRTDDPRLYMNSNGTAIAAAPYQRLQPKPVRPPLIPDVDQYEPDKSEEGILTSFAKLILNTGSSTVEILGALFTRSSRNKKRILQHHPHQRLQHHQYLPHPQATRHGYIDNQPWPVQDNRPWPVQDNRPWPVQDSYVIDDEDEPPTPLETTRRSPPLMRRSNNYPALTTPEETQNRVYYSKGGAPEFQPHQQQQQQQRQRQEQGRQQKEQQQQQRTNAASPGVRQQQQQRQQRGQQKQEQPVQPKMQQHHQKHYSSATKKCYEKKGGETNEIVFGEVGGQDGRRQETVVIKAVDYSDPIYNHHNIQSRSVNYMGYSFEY